MCNCTCLIMYFILNITFQLRSLQEQVRPVRDDNLCDINIWYTVIRYLSFWDSFLRIAEFWDFIHNGQFEIITILTSIFWRKNIRYPHKGTSKNRKLIPLRTDFPITFQRMGIHMNAVRAVDIITHTDSKREVC